jgi:galactokinase
MHEESAENQERTRRLVEEFRRRYEGEPIVVRAPGRVNLIGEHTDYNDGFVLPIAIDHDVRLAVRPRGDRIVRLHSLNFSSDTEFDLDHLERDEQHRWGNYVRGMAVELMKDGRLLHGMEGVVEGNVPLASGLSSSAAMEVASGLAFLAASKEVVEPRELAVMAQSAEINYMGVRCGIMDQFVSRMGFPGHALFLDCRTLDYELVPIKTGDYVFVATDSRQSRELAGSAYNERRAQCEAAVKQLSLTGPQVCALRDVTQERLEQAKEQLDPVVYRRARHVVTENDRVQEAVAALKSGDLPRFGALMNDSHESLRDDYEVSSPALDSLVAAAREVEGCLGSRLTGAGFGGCTVSLVRKDRIDAFREHVGRLYQEDYDLEPYFYVTAPAAGAGLCTPQGCPTVTTPRAA